MHSSRNPESPTPAIERVTPAAALPGGDIRVEGRGLKPMGEKLPEAFVGSYPAHVLMASPRVVQVRVPENATAGTVQVACGVAPEQQRSNEAKFSIAISVADNLHPVANPAIDGDGNIYTTFSGARGQTVPNSLFVIDAGYQMKPLGAAIINPTGLALDRAGALYVSSRQEGIVYKVALNGVSAVYAEGMGIGTGLAFDEDENLYVGDRSGTIFKIDRNRNTFVFATLEPSVAAYHLAFGPDRYLYVTGPTTSSFDTIWRISPAGVVEPFYRGLGRPQGCAFDELGNFYVVGSLRGRRGVVRINQQGIAELCVSGNNLVGLAFTPGPGLVLATNSGLLRLPWPTAGKPLPPAPRG